MITDPTRKDAGLDSPKLTIHIEVDLTRSYTTVETSVQDSVVFIRIMGDAMRVFADELLRARTSAAPQRVKLASSPDLPQ